MDGSLKERVKKIKAVVFDGYGVFFSEYVYLAPQGEALVKRSHIDGQGLSLLRAAGIFVAIVSGEKVGFTDHLLEKLNKLPSVIEGKWKPILLLASGDKLAQVEGWLKANNIEWDECAYMGDDIGDFKIIKKVGLAIVPAQAEEIIKKISHFVTARRGGDGAVRDACNLILEGKGIDILNLPTK